MIDSQKLIERRAVYSDSSGRSLECALDRTYAAHKRVTLLYITIRMHVMF